MRFLSSIALAAAALVVSSSLVLAAPALEVLGKDFAFPSKIEGMPGRLSDFQGLQINTFETSDGVTLSYWEAGKGEPLIFVPGWSANGAEYINVMYLLAKKHRVIVLDPRNQGLSEKVEYGSRISRFGADLKELVDHLGIEKADFCGWSMGASVIWSYIDLFGTKTIRKAVFVDEPISIYSHSDWSEQERLDAGGTTTSAEQMVAGYTAGAPLNSLVTDLKALQRSMLKDSPYFVNSGAFASVFVKTDPEATRRVLFDHVTNDWRDVLTHKINVPVAIFSGEESSNLPSQRWAASTIPDATLYSYTSAEQGDHFLMFKNPIKFTNDLTSFLER
ncbi:MAG: alpha/beta hydrolase [Gammaproteobacteria bacterium]|nr:alpha/beta hydrolase [Rhizobiaceae bacterium]MBU4115493.1 alpha/beta hydrolase [Gammaproteobacteria bacterium]